MSERSLEKIISGFAHGDLGITTLPASVLVAVLRFLLTGEAADVDSLHALGLSCQRMHSFVECRELWASIPLVTSKGKFNSTAIKVLSRRGRGTEGVREKVFCRPMQLTLLLRRHHPPHTPEKDLGIQYNTLRELAIMKELNHSGVCSASWMHYNSSFVYLLYPYYEISLEDLLQVRSEARKRAVGENGLAEIRPLQPRAARLFIEQLSSALSYCHERHIVHRNVKPRHMMISAPPDALEDPARLETARVILTDFAMARKLHAPLSCEAGSGGRCGDRWSYTLDVGSLWYRCPEMLLGLREYGAGVDMWAAGCVWAEMLVGEPLFTGQSGIDQLFKIFRVCGSPDTVIWPGLERLPHYQKDLFPEWRKPRLRCLMEVADEADMDLLTRLLALNPAERVSAAAASTHRYTRALTDMPTSNHASNRHEKRYLVSQRDSVLGRGLDEAIRAFRSLNACLRAQESERQHIANLDETAKAMRKTVVDWMFRMHLLYEDRNSARGRDHSFDVAVSVFDAFQASMSCTTNPLVQERKNRYNLPDSGAYCTFENSSSLMKDLHVVGGACFLIASKWEDLRPLTVEDLAPQLMPESAMDDFATRSVHRKLMILLLKRYEEVVLHVLDYKVASPTLASYIDIAHEMIVLLRTKEFDAFDIDDDYGARVRCMTAYLKQVFLIENPFTCDIPNDVMAFGILTYAARATQEETTQKCVHLALDRCDISRSGVLRALEATKSTLASVHRSSAVFEAFSSPQSRSVALIPLLSDRVISAPILEN